MTLLCISYPIQRSELSFYCYFTELTRYLPVLELATDEHFPETEKWEFIINGQGIILWG